jgi:hypothetical protein
MRKWGKTALWLGLACTAVVSYRSAASGEDQILAELLAADENLDTDLDQPVVPGAMNYGPLRKGLKFLVL